jgi:hypothetical protein
MLSQRSIRSNRDRRHARGMRFLRPKRGLMPHQADFIFGQVRTDVTLEACVFLGQNGALCRVKRTSSLVKLEPTLRSRRALAQAKSCLMPHQADFIFGQIRTDAMLQACAYSGQIGDFHRVKRTSSSVKSGPTPRSRRALTQAKSGPFAVSSGLHLRSNQDRRHAPGMRLLRPNRGLLPHQADFIFGHDDK